MKIKHKLTGDEVVISRLKWDDEYLPKKLDKVYDVLEDDCVLLREILDNGDRIPYKKFDRDHAIRMVHSNPLKYDFVEVHEVMSDEEKIDVILDALDKAYPSTLHVNDYVIHKFNSSIRERHILVDRLIEEGLAKSLGNPDHRMLITSSGMNKVKSGGYLKSSKSGEEKTLYNPSDKFTESEKESVSEKLEELFKKLERLETGQRLIYDDLLEEIEELKKLTTVLGKKNWMEILNGKLISFGLGKLADGGFDLIVEAFKEERLLNS